MLLVLLLVDTPPGEVVTKTTVKKLQPWLVTLASGRRAWILAEKKKDVTEWVEQQ